jgi:hypothetical protein
VSGAVVNIECTSGSNCGLRIRERRMCDATCLGAAQLVLLRKDVVEDLPLPVAAAEIEQPQELIPRAASPTTNPSVVEEANELLLVRAASHLVVRMGRTTDVLHLQLVDMEPHVTTLLSKSGAVRAAGCILSRAIGATQ